MAEGGQLLFKNAIKCVIWDLDETIWEGSLAENTSITPKHRIVELISALNGKGIINSICSKNEYETAKLKLQSLGIWDFFVFPVIGFVPKGQNIKEIIELLQLRAENVLFVDDNAGNRNEAQYYCEKIMVADPNDEGFLAAMKDVVARTSGESRLERYKLLEKKHIAKSQFSDNIQFLRDSNIVVCVLRNPADLTFKERIFELANRTNQLNFTGSRFATMADFENYFESQQSININHGVIFVYDKYGDYGLVGFYAFDEQRDKKTLDHFLFSCRILNMGVEQAVYQYLCEQFTIKKYEPMEKRMGIDTSYITIIQEMDEHLKDYVNNQMNNPQHYKTSIIAGCTSGIISHYLSKEMQPARFDNFDINAPCAVEQADSIIYTVYSEYVNYNWRRIGGLSYSKFKSNFEKFVSLNSDKQMYVLLSSEKYPEEEIKGFKNKIKQFAKFIVFGKDFSRYLRCNEIVRVAAKNYNNVRIVEMGDFIMETVEQINPRHFERIVIKRFCESIHPEDIRTM
jgi:FkbH-like protein